MDSLLPTFREALLSDVSADTRLPKALQEALSVHANNPDVDSPEALVVGAFDLLEHHRSGPAAVPRLSDALFDYRQQLDMRSLRKQAQAQLPDGPSLTILRNLTEDLDNESLVSQVRRRADDGIQAIQRALHTPESAKGEAEVVFKAAIAQDLSKLQAKGLAPAGEAFLRAYAHSPSGAMNEGQVETEVVQVIKTLQESELRLANAPTFFDALYEHRPSLDLRTLRQTASEQLAEGAERTIMDTYTELGMAKKGFVSNAIRALDDLGESIGSFLGTSLSEKRQARLTQNPPEPTSRPSVSPKA